MTTLDLIKDNLCIIDFNMLGLCLKFKSKNYEYRLFRNSIIREHHGEYESRVFKNEILIGSTIKFKLEDSI